MRRSVSLALSLLGAVSFGQISVTTVTGISSGSGGTGITVHQDGAAQTGTGIDQACVSTFLSTIAVNYNISGMGTTVRTVQVDFTTGAFPVRLDSLDINIRGRLINAGGTTIPVSSYASMVRGEYSLGQASSATAFVPIFTGTTVSNTLNGPGFIDVDRATAVNTNGVILSAHRQFRLSFSQVVTMMSGTVTSGPTVGVTWESGFGKPDSSFRMNTTTLPEPASMATIGLGLAILRRRKARR